jgi:hypothetical protein
MDVEVQQCPSVRTELLDDFSEEITVKVHNGSDTNSCSSTEKDNGRKKKLRKLMGNSVGQKLCKNSICTYAFGKAIPVIGREGS